MLMLIKDKIANKNWENFNIRVRGAESRTWARGQLKYNGFPVLWTPKQTETMPQFCPNYEYDVISKKRSSPKF